MKARGHSTNPIKISKIGLLENDKKLLIKKLALNNLSHINFSEEKDKQNNKKTNTYKVSKTISSVKKDLKKLNNSSLLIKIKNHSISKTYENQKKFEKIITKNNNTYNNNNNNISIFSSHEIINEFNRNKKTIKSNKSSIVNINLFNKNKSYAILPINPLINKKTKTNLSNSLNKSIKIKNGKRNKTFINSLKTTATNSYKDIKSNKIINVTNVNGKANDNSSKKDSFFHFDKNRNNCINKKNNDKMNQTMNAINLLNELKKQNIKNKEQSFKIFNDNIFINTNNNFYNDKIKFKGKTNKNSPNKNTLNKRYIFNSPQKNEQINNINQNNYIQNINIKNISSNLQINIINNNINREEVKKSIISESNENSEDTRKESGLDLHKLFSDKTFININKNNIINEIISNNMKINFSKKNSYKNIHNQNLNAQSEQNSISYNDIKNNDKQKHLNFFNNLIKKNSYEKNKLLNESIKNENYSSVINENHITGKNYKSSKILDHFFEIQISQDKNSAQTCATGDKFCKISKYVKQPIYNITNRNLIDDKVKGDIPNHDYKFISDVIKGNKSIFDMKKILKLNDITIFKILSFSYDNFTSISKSNKLLRNKINISFKNIFQHVIDDFKLKYKNFLNVLNFSFEPKTININGKKNYLFNLIIECQIICQDIKKSYEIGCDYISYGKKYDNKWKFDVHKKEDIKVWLCTELDVINNINKKFTYTSQVASFCCGDKLELQFNIFSEGTSIDPISIEWSEPIITHSKPDIYQNSKFISSISFDQLRACEIETQILFWKSNLPKDDNNIINDFKNIFENFFKIKSIFFDVSKFYFFKFVTIANKIGVLKQNKFSTFDVNIIDNKENIKNEIQCIYLINSNYYKKSMDIRLGTCVTFYIVDMKR